MKEDRIPINECIVDLASLTISTIFRGLTYKFIFFYLAKAQHEHFYA